MFSTTISVNKYQMSNWKVDQDNVKYFDNIMRNSGTFYCLDSRPYIEFLNEFGISFKTAD
jgi:hypothetical protein